MNKEIEILYKNLEAKDKIINEQVLEIAKLKNQKQEAIECIHLFGIYKDTPDKGLDIRKILKNILEILGDKE